MKYMTLKPRISEKAYALSEQGNTYVFDVPADANKHDIAKSVAGQYEVKVTAVRIVGVPGKAVRSYRQRGRRSIQGKRSDIRKAYVTLAQGEKLPIFAAVESPEAPKENK
ncbi:MAG TPA: 50S ribosomal protein L23 [Candidatus Saccharimonadales bacterium]|nr:50S ribosomal protein L23 [Candidatus Saccharimonadales bacterium]